MPFRVSRASLIPASIAMVSAVIAFTFVRVWFVPVRATPMVSARVNIDTQPAGAELMIDDQLRGTTPIALSIEPGTHTLTVRTARLERSVRLTLAAGAHASQYFDLTSNEPSVAEPGWLSIVTDPPGARVAVDGVSRGISPTVIDNLSAAAHIVAVTSDTGSATRTVTVKDGVATEVVFSLLNSAAPLAGWIVVTSPFPVDVIERDEVVGTSGTTKIMLGAGRHDLVLRSDRAGYETSRAIEVAAGRVTPVEIVAPIVLLNVNARPWADVLIDGTKVGQTPLANIEVTAGAHNITFRHPDFAERTEAIIVTAKGVNRVSVDLTK